MTPFKCPYKDTMLRQQDSFPAMTKISKIAFKKKKYKYKNININN